MKRSVIFWILGGVVLVVAGAFAYLWFAGGSGEPSTDLTTPTIAGATTTTGNPSNDSTTPGSTVPGSTVASAGTTAFVIDATQSVASFEIDEILRGEPNRVVGTTSEVAGQVQVDPTDPSTVQFSQIIVNARTFETDSGNRDRQIRGPVILNSASDEFELITFDVTSVDGLSEALDVGEEVAFTITGDLQIRGTTQPVSFDVTATLVDDSTIQGEAATTVLRSDFGIGIPSVPSVADVGDEVVIRLEFIATS
jgi:polyisoprenoid-binding protein YceI